MFSSIRARSSYCKGRQTEELIPFVMPASTHHSPPTATSDWLRCIPLLRARALLDFNGREMPSFAAAARLRWADPDPPALVLFISHRWRTRTHPDPNGESLARLVAMLGALDRLARGLEPMCDAPTPDLREPWMLHASVLLSRLMEAEVDGTSALERVALFYDYSCLPQGNTLQELQTRRAGLACFPSMIADTRVTLLALRNDEDDYEQRAWCVAESVLALTFDEGRPWAQTFPLRLGASLPAPVIGYAPLRDAIEAWASRTAGIPELTSAQYREWLEIVEQCARWHQEVRDDATWLHHSGCGAERSFRLFLETMLRLREAAGGEIDLAGVLPEVAAAVGLYCSEARDVIPASLLILTGLRWEKLNRGADPTRAAEPDLWLQALEHYREGQPLLARVETSTDPQRLPRVLLVPNAGISCR
jgi:hypothetical protein